MYIMYKTKLNVTENDYKHHRFIDTYIKTEFQQSPVCVNQPFSDTSIVQYLLWYSYVTVMHLGKMYNAGSIGSCTMWVYLILMMEQCTLPLVSACGSHYHCLMYHYLPYLPTGLGTGTVPLSTLPISRSVLYTSNVQ